MVDSKSYRFELHSGPVDPAPSTLDDDQRELLDRAASGIRIRGNSTRILLKWKTARRLREEARSKAA
jgi:hypothetical protein